MPKCSFETCDIPAKYKRLVLCDGHNKQRRKGVPLTHLQNRTGSWTLEGVLERATPEGRCLRWSTGDDYSQIWHDGASWKTHRLVMHLSIGRPITGEAVHHICAHRWCIQPAHLQLATTAENTLEMLERKSLKARIAALELEVAQLKGRIQELEKVSICA